MTRFRSVLLAIGALVVSAGVVAGFSTLPTQATAGLEKASDASGQTVPARPVAVPPTTTDVNVATPDIPDAAGHGADVSAVATGEDATPDTNRGADVSAVAKQNHGQAVAAAHVPNGVGKPDTAGKPETVGKPASPGKP